MAERTVSTYKGEVVERFFFQKGDVKEMLPRKAIDFIDEKANEAYRQRPGGSPGDSLGRLQLAPIRRGVNFLIHLGVNLDDIEGDTIYEIGSKKVRGGKAKLLYNESIFYKELPDVKFLSEDLVPKLVPEVVSHLSSLTEEQRKDFMQFPHMVLGDPAADPKRGTNGISWGTIAPDSVVYGDNQSLHHGPGYDS